MAVRHLFSCAAVAALMLSSCIYPFEPGIETTDSRLVIEGTISIGGTSTFSFSRVMPFTSKEYDSQAIEVTGYIEGEDGSRINPAPFYPETPPTYDFTKDYVDYFSGSAQSQSTIKFDTPATMPDQRYRVHFEEKVTGAVYESDWLEVCAQPVIDDLRYILDYDRDELNVALSMHCNGYQYFRWYYEETWEYHADLNASHYLEPSLMWDHKGNYQPEAAMIKFTMPDNHYYCWKSEKSPNVKIFSTAEQQEDRFTDLEFHRVSRFNNKLQMLYRLRVHLEAISEEAYLYWKNIDENTNNQGSIFAPVPSQMLGNIHCLTDPSAEVIGYVNASREAMSQMYFNNLLEGFYDGRATDWNIVTIEEFYDPSEFALWYSRGYLPYTFVSAQMSDTGLPTYMWAPARCVDCRYGGGTKNRPIDWPNNDV